MLNQNRWHNYKKNTHTKIKYDVIQFEQFEFSTFLCIQKSHTNVFELIRLIHDHFHKHFDIWKLKFLFELLMLKNFKLMHIAKNIEINVKFKTRHCFIDYDRKKKLKIFNMSKKTWEIQIDKYLFEKINEIFFESNLTTIELCY